MESGSDHSLPVKGNLTWATYDGIPETRLGLEGHHQVHNAANAVICARRLGWSKAAIRKGLREAKHPGRFEIISRKPRIILDGAHNPKESRLSLSD
ncbi:hypothetical protein OVA29_06300 [Exiguobacterium sp. SL14]|nr:hypothetical protein [Exiguobacterium sp. SL14]MCY1690397.1 hypothetical protein [Exiguobacterium sp. SL14]